VSPQLSGVANAVNDANTSYANTTEDQNQLMSSFILTLTLVLLLAMVSAIYLAIRAARRLTRPVQDLIEGTSAVGKGDFGTRLALPSCMVCASADTGRRHHDPGDFRTRLWYQGSKACVGCRRANGSAPAMGDQAAGF
jgi:methyl-accepting chemotaxis protein